MKKKAKKESKESYPAVDNYARLRISMFMHAGIYTILMIAIVGGLGYLLDQVFGTYPKLLIVGLFLGYPLTVIVLRKQFKKIAEKKVKKINNGES